MQWKRWSLGTVLRRWIMGGAALTVLSCCFFVGCERDCTAWARAAGLGPVEERFVVVYPDGLVRISARRWPTSTSADATFLTDFPEPMLSRVLATYPEETWRKIPARSAPGWLVGARYETRWGAYRAIRSYGWPWRAIRIGYYGRSFTPLPVGVLLNTLVLGSLLLPIAWLLPDSTDARGLWKKIRGETRFEQGLCLKCGYHLHGNYENGCPECGRGKNGS